MWNLYVVSFLNTWNLIMRFYFKIYPAILANIWDFFFTEEKRFFKDYFFSLQI